MKKRSQHHAHVISLCATVWHKHLMSNSIKCKTKYHAANDFNAFLPNRYNPKMFVFKDQQKEEYIICGIIMY